MQALRKVLWVVFVVSCLVGQLTAKTVYVNAVTGSDAYDGLTTNAPLLTLQAAVDLAVSGDVVLAAPGVYSQGGRAVPGATCTNRVVIDKAVQVISAGGPEVTAIAGRSAAPTLRCVWLADGATLSGFTLTNGTSLATGDFVKDRLGGGVWSQPGGVVSNCVIAFNGTVSVTTGGGAAFGRFFDCNFTSNNAAWGAGAYSSQCARCTFVGNSASSGGGAGSLCDYRQCLLTANSSVSSHGGAYMGTLTDCVLSNNVCSGSGAGAGYALLERCLVIGNIASGSGGGLLGGAASRCTLTGNRSASYGGAAYQASLTNCLIWGNAATNGGGGIFMGNLLNCTVVSNRTLRTSGPLGGGVGNVISVKNCIIKFNQALTFANYYPATPTIDYSCTDPVPVARTGVIGGDPSFFSSANFRLSAASPCRDAGTTNGVNCGALDLDGRPRVLGSGVDMGVYEYPTNLALSVSFPVTDMIFPESAATVTVTAALSAPAYEDLTVAYTLAGPATNDVSAVDGAFFFPAGSSNATVRVAILDDADPEPSESVTFTLEESLGVTLAHHRWFFLTVAASEGCPDIAAWSVNGGSFATLSPEIVIASTCVNDPSECIVSTSPLFDDGAAWQPYTNALTYTLSSMGWQQLFFKVRRALDGYGDVESGTVSEWVRLDVPLAQALDTELPVTADSDWYGQTGATWDGMDAASCDTLWSVTGERSLSVQVSGPATGSFAWATTLFSGAGSDVSLTFSIDGVPVSSISGDAGWLIVPITVGEGQHTLRWTYAETDLNADGSGFLDALSIVQLPVHYVWKDSPAPEAPYLTWDTAAHTIQEAVDVAAAGETVVVTNGVYDTGARATPGFVLPNRVNVSGGVSVRSVNGPQSTVILGAGPVVGAGAVRCAYLNSGATLSGFTLADGATLDATAVFWEDQCGAAVYSANTETLVVNCLLTNSVAQDSGGAAYSGSLRDCVLAGNRTLGPWGTGGGANSSVLSRCRVYGNTANSGGGTAYGSLDDCLLVGNRATDQGGASAWSFLTHCTVVGNASERMGGGVVWGSVNNSIVYFNEAPSRPNYEGGWNFFFSCSSPALPSNPGNLSCDPGFANTNNWSDLRLTQMSLLVDAGSADENLSAEDLDGNPRISGVRADLGAYEWQGAVLPVVDLSVAAESADEDGGTNVVTISLSAPLAEDVTFSLAYSGTAARDTDYSGAPLSVDFLAGETQSVFVVTGIADVLPEHRETVVVDLQPQSGFRLGTLRKSFALIDNDGMPEVLDFQLNGGQGGTDTNAVWLTYAVTNGPAEYAVGEDPTFSNAVWSAYAEGPLAYTLSEGYGEKCVWFAVRKPDGLGQIVSLPVSDSIMYGPPLAEAIDLPAFEVLTGGDQGAQWFSEMDAETLGGACARSALPASGQSWVSSWLSLSTNLAGPSRLSFSYAFVGSGGFELYIDGMYFDLEDQLPGWRTFEIELQPGLRTFQWVAYGNGHEGSVPGYARLDAVAIAALPPRVRFTLGATSAAESADDVPVALALEYAPTSAVTVAYATSGTATPGSDYTVEPAGAVTFAPGVTETSLWVRVANDAAPEHGETVLIALTSAAGARMGVETNHTFTILANDGILDVYDLLLADGAPSTLSRTVRVSVVCSETPAEFKASESPDLAGAEWQPYSDDATVTLSAGYGLKTVWVKVRKPLDGGYAESDPLSASITLLPTLAGALGVEAAETGGASAWFGQLTNTVDGAAAQSGALSSYWSSTWARTTLAGSGMVRFKWKFETAYLYYNWITCLKDGVQAAFVEVPGDWAEVTLTFDTPGMHTVEWQYNACYPTTVYPSAALVDQVTLVDWVALTAAPPQFDPSDGTLFTATQEVALTCATVGAQIRYTLDGSDPTTNSALYAGPLTLTETTIVKARAFKASYADSALAQATYTKSNATPLFSPPSGTVFANSLDVTITSAVATAEIRYTLDGSEPKLASALYAGPVTLTGTTTVKAMAFLSGVPVSQTVAAMYTLQTVDTPTFEPGSGLLFDTRCDVAVACAIPGADIRYTLDGGEPTTNSALYAEPLAFTNALTLIRARAFKAGLAPSAIAQASYVRRGALLVWGYNGYGECDVPEDLTNAVAFAVGQHHLLALRADGTVIAWGDNGYGRASVPAGLGQVIAVAASDYHSLALRADGTVAGWGYNGYGESSAPADLSNVVAVAAGDYHSLALRADGTVCAWGYNGHGQTAIPGGLSNVIAVAAGKYHSLALRADGTIIAWGDNNYGQIAAPGGLSNAVAIAADEYHSLALRTDGTVVAWGYNGYGEGSVPADLSNVVAVAAGQYHSLALRADGTVAAGGLNDYGQSNVPTGLVHAALLGGGGHNSAVLFGDVTPLAATPPSGRWIPAEAGTLPITLSGATDGGTIRYTLNGSEPSDSDATYAGPLELSVATTLKARLFRDGVASGATLTAHYPKQAAAPVLSPSNSEQFIPPGGVLSITLASPEPGVTLRYTLDGSEPTADSAVYGGALNLTQTTRIRVRAFRDGFAPSAIVTTLYGMSGGLLGWGYDGYGGLSFPDGLSNVVQVCAGHYHTMALFPNGTVGVWGPDWNGLKSGAAILTNVIAIAAGDSHAVALRSDGTVTAWGENSYGRASVPAGLRDVVAVAAAVNNTAALKADGSVVVWGYADYGICTPPAGLTNAVSVELGGNHAVALRADGTVTAWGSNGNNETNVPPELSDVVALAAGDSHSVALRADGTVVCWGYNGYGQTSVPAGLTNVIAVAAGSRHTVALRADGKVVCWGYNEYGQVLVSDDLPPVAGIAAGNYHTVALFGRPSPVTFTPPSGRWIPPQFDALPVHILGAFGGGTVRYTLDGTEPTDVAAVYAGALTLTNATTVKARLFRAGVASGAVRVANYPKRAAAPVFTPSNDAQYIPPGGVLSVTLSTPDAGATLRYTLDGSEPTAASAVYEGTLPLAQTATLKARAYRDLDLMPSEVTTAVYALDGGLLGWGWNGYGQLSLPPGISNAVQVSAGYYHTMALLPDGTIGLWGPDWYGLKSGAAALNNVISITLGDSHAAALRSDGTVAAWGENSYGRASVPAGLRDVVAVAAGVNNTAALKADGSVVVWGYADYGICTPPAGLTNAVSVELGGNHAVALRADGTVTAWGYNGHSQTNVPPGLSDVVALAVGDNHSVALRANGTVVCWGYNGRGQASVPAGLTNVVAVAAGSEYTVALRADGSSVCWGNNDNGQCNVPAGLPPAAGLAAGGYHTVALFRSPSPLAFVPPSGRWIPPASGVLPVRLLAASGGGTIRYTLDGAEPTDASAAYAGVLELASTTTVKARLFREGVASGAVRTSVYTKRAAAPVFTPSNDAQFIPPGGALSVTLSTTDAGATIRYTLDDSEPTAESAVYGGALNLAQTTMVKARAFKDGVLMPSETASALYALEGGVLGWGYNGYSQIDLPPGLSNVVQVSAGYYNTLALLPNGTVRAWGYGGYGVTSIPADFTNVVALALSYHHAVALRSDGTVTGWGNNDYGKSTAPAGLLDVVAIAAGRNNSAVLKADGSVQVWGYHGHNVTNAPAGLSDVTSIALGDNHALALKADGTVVAWGYNGNSQTNVPPGLVNVAAVAAGDNHSVALRADGTVICWGYNGSGQTSVPAGLFGVIAIAAGSDHTVALRADGTVVAWGYNGYGQCTLPSGLSRVSAISASGNNTLVRFGSPTPVSLTPPSGMLVPGGGYPFPVRVLGATLGGTIRYTLDTTAPTAESSAYAGPLLLGDATTVKAALFTNGVQAGAAATAFYPLLPGGVVFHTVTTEATPAEAGTSSGGGIVRKNGATTVTAVVTNGSKYVFGSWRVNGSVVSTLPVYTFTVTANRTLTAVFDLATYPITVTSVPYGFGWVYDQTWRHYGTYWWSYGVTNTLTAYPQEGCRFLGWRDQETDALITTNRSYTLAVTNAVSVKALFEDIVASHTVTTRTEPAGLAVIGGAGSYTNGQQLVLTAPAAITNNTLRYVFQHFSRNGVPYTSANPWNWWITRTDPAEADISAVYAAQPLSPRVRSASHTLGTPVPMTDNLRASVVFDRQMNLAVLPSLTVSNVTGSIVRVLPATGSWGGTHVGGDTYQSPAIGFSRGEDGDYVITVAGAVDTYGGSVVRTNVLFFTVDATPPNVPALRVTASNETAFTVGWSSYTPSEALSGFRFYVSKTYFTNTLEQSPLSFIGSSERAYEYRPSGGIELDATYWVAVVPVDAVGNRETVIVPLAVRIPRGIPPAVVFTVTATGADTARLDWPTYVGDSLGFAEFRIFQDTNAFSTVSNRTPLAVTGKLLRTYTAAGLDRAVTNWFSVVGFNARGESLNVVTSLPWTDPYQGVITNSMTLGSDGSTLEILNSLTVRAGATLTVPPGATLAFRAGASLTVESGALIANGTALKPIRFTSALTNAPGAGDWNGVTLLAQAGGSILRHVWIEYGMGLSVSGCSPTVDAFTARYNAGAGLSLLSGGTLATRDALLLYNAVAVRCANGTTGTVSHSIIRNNVTNALAEAGASLTATNVWWGSAEPATIQSGFGGAVVAEPFLGSEPVLTPAADTVNGVRAVGTNTVDVVLAGRVAEAVQISEDSGFEGAFYDSFEARKSVVLSAGGGLKTLYIRFRNAAGQVSDTVTIPVEYLTGGPAITDCNLHEGSVLTRPFVLTASASSGLGIATLRVLADDVLVTSTNAAGLSARWDIRSLAPGTHRIRVEVTDLHGDLGTRAFNVTANIQPPANPVLTAPVDDLLTTEAAVAASGTAEPFVSVALRRNGTVVEQVTADANGVFSATATLTEGENILVATVTDAFGTGRSNERRVTRDQGAPNPVTLGPPIYRPGIGLHTEWYFPAEGERPLTVLLLRSEVPFASEEEATWQGEWTTDNPLISVPPSDGRWYFAAVGRDKANNHSPLSNLITNDYDGTYPTFGVTYDKASPCGLGALRLTIESSEPLRGYPTVTVQPPAASGSDMLIMLTVSNTAPNRYSCVYNVQRSTGSGLLAVKVSGTDLAGNRAQSVVPAGTAMVVDIRAPVGFLTLSPSGLIQVTNPVPLQVSLALDEVPSAAPVLQFHPPEGAPVAVALTGGGTNWNGLVELLPIMGSGIANFTLAVSDALGNAGTQLDGTTAVELYNTALPSPPVRVTFLRASTDQKGGLIKLTWISATDAESYALYRQAGEFGSTPDQLVAANLLATTNGYVHLQDGGYQYSALTDYDDMPPVDDFYRYVVVASRRGASAAPSPEARGISDRTPPPVPQNLTAALSSSGVRVDWEYAVSGEQPEYFRVYRNGTLLRDRVSASTRFILDNPDAGTWSYAVSSVDRNANEALSNSDAIDLTLPAVTRTDVRVGSDLVPHLTWVKRAEHVGVNLYRNGAKLNGTPLGGASFSDTELTGAGVTRYEVRGVGADGAESAGRELPVYHLSFGFAVNPDVERSALLRYFDCGVVTINNRTDGATFESSQLILTRTVAGGASLTRTNLVTQAAGAGGSCAVGATFPCATAPGAQSFAATVVQALDDPSASVRYEASFEGGTPSLAQSQIEVTVTNQPVAGAACVPQARFYNRGQVPIDLVMWRNGQPGDVTVRVLDAHEMEVNRTDVMVVKASLSPTPDGLRGFLRIPAKGSLFLTLPEIIVPEALGEEASAFIEVKANNIYVSCGEAGEQISGPLTGRLTITPRPTPYTAFGLSEKAVYQAGDTLVITGYAFDRVTGARMTNVAVSAGIALDGYAWYVEAQSDAAGNFRAEWPIIDGISGICQVWASHPQVRDHLNQGETSIYQAYFRPQEGSVRMAANDILTLSLNAFNPSTFTFTNLTSTFTAWQVTDGVTNLLPLAVVSGAVSQVESLALLPKQQVPVTLTLFATEEALPSFYCRFEIVTPEGMRVPFDAAVSVTEPLPLITVATPACGYVDMSLDRGKTRSADVELRNDGFKALLGVKMTAPTIPWMHVALKQSMDGTFALPDIAPGQSFTFQVLYAPGDAVAMSFYNDALSITGTNTMTAKAVNLYAKVTSELRGRLFFHVENTLGQEVPDASIRLRSALDGTERTGFKTDENGDVEIAELMEGRWHWQVSAAGHATQAGTSQVEAGTTTEVDPVINRELVTVTFSVVPVPFTDRYEIKIEQTFSTYVPAPVLVVNPSYLDLGTAEGPFEYNFIATAKNYGLIKLTEFTVNGSQQTWGSLVPAITYLPVLAPMQQVEIPFTVSYWGDAADGAPEGAPPARQMSGLNGRHLAGDESTYDPCADDFMDGLKSLLARLAGMYGTQHLAIPTEVAAASISILIKIADKAPIGFGTLMNIYRFLYCLAEMLGVMSGPGGPGGGGGGDDGGGRAYDSGGCFAAGTEVLMADGTLRAIEAVRPGTVVRTGPRKTDLAHVSETYSRANVAIRQLTLDNGVTLRTTAEHRIWVDSRGWSLAKDIRAGDRVACLNDTTAVVTSVATSERAETVYTLELREDTAFYAQGVLVRHLCGMQFPNLTPTHGTQSRTKGGAQ